MTKKKPFALRVDAALMEALEKWAADEFRSTNGQIEWILSRAVKESGRSKETKKKQEPGTMQE
ncbi:MAG: Arc family DNA binding domain-containing protein [Bacteroidia bacterium]|nr:Arc family DNA binding domain-containing protein [Bacteroidia bacterium]